MMNAISRSRAVSSVAGVFDLLEPSADDDGVWIAELPAFGIVTEGRGSDGARKAGLDAIRGYVEVASRLGKPVPDGDLIDIPGSRRRSAAHSAGQPRRKR